MNIKTKKTIGLLVSFTPEVFKGDYFTQVLTGVTNALIGTPHDLRLIMVKEEDALDPEKVILDEHDIDGLILLTWRIHTRYIEEGLKRKNIPVVVINDPTEDLQANIVSCDNRAGMHLALRHVLSRGYKKIGMLHAPDDASLDARERFDLLKQLLEQYKLSFDPAHYRKCEYFFEEDGYLKMLDIIQTAKTLPRVMFCVNDDIAIGAMRALKENWISCPQQVAIIGYDGIRKGRYTDPTLTTISQPLEQMGREMVRILFDQIESGDFEKVQKVIEPELVIRKSC